MTLSSGDAPTLKAEALLRAVEINAAAQYDGGFPVQQLFMAGNGGRPRLVPFEKVSVDLVYDDRREGAWHSQPVEGDRFLHTRIGEVDARVLYQSYKDYLRSNHAARLREAGFPAMGGSGDPIGAALRDQALRAQNGIIRKGTAHCLRNREIMTCAALKNATSYTVSIDGNSTTFTTSVNSATSGADWATASTDVFADMGKFVRTFEDQAGERPTHIIYDARLIEDLAKNSDVRDLAIRLNGNGVITALPTAMIPELAGVTPIKVMGHYKNSSGTKTYYWDRYTITLLALSSPADVLDAFTVPTERDSYQGGLYSYSWQEQETRDTGVMVGDNFGAAILNTDKVLVCDVSGP